MPATEPAAQDAAVIDIGSNSVRLVLYRLEGRAVWTIYNEKVLAGLGRDLPATGRLSPTGAEMAMTALKRFAAVIEGVRPQRVLTAATAAVREAVDGSEFRERVTAQTGLQIRVLSGEEEARYAALGALAGAPQANGVVGDLGGASLELTRVTRGEVSGGVTLPLGPFVLSSANGFQPAALRRTIATRLKPVASDYAAQTLYAVGGAWRSLAQVHMALTDYPLRIVHQYEMSAADALSVSRLVARQSKASLEQIPGLSRKRAETLPHAALVLEGLIERLGLERVEFSAWGVREGVLFETVDPEVTDADPLLAGCTALGARQGISPGLAGALHGWITGLTQEMPEAFGPKRDDLLAQAACRLADLGARLHPDHRVDLVFEQVLRAPIPGQSHAERAFLATTLNARYGGASATPQPNVIDRLLPEPARTRARALGLAIRLASDLSGRSPQLLANATASVRNGVLLLQASQGYHDLLLGEQARRRAKALAEAMRLKVEIGSVSAAGG